MTRGVGAIPALLAAAILGAAGLGAATVAAPADRVSSFLRAYRRLGFSGLPNAREERALAPYLSPRLREMMARAQAEQTRFAAANPGEKPPLVEGDLFSSLFEGPTSFTVGETRSEGGRAVVTVVFSYADPVSKPPPFSWKDHFLLVQIGGRWLLDDVEYLGGWGFAQKGRLAEALEDVARGMP
jgi:hypothetical protein